MRVIVLSLSLARFGSFECTHFARCRNGNSDYTQIPHLRSLQSHMDKSRWKTYMSKKFRCIIFLGFGVSMFSTLSVVFGVIDEAMTFCLEECCWQGMIVHRMSLSHQNGQRE